MSALRASWGDVTQASAKAPMNAAPEALTGRGQRARVLRGNVVVEAVVVGQGDHTAAFADLSRLEAQIPVVRDRASEALCSA